MKVAIWWIVLAVIAALGIYLLTRPAAAQVNPGQDAWESQSYGKKKKCPDCVCKCPEPVHCPEIPKCPDVEAPDYFCTPVEQPCYDAYGKQTVCAPLQ